MMIRNKEIIWLLPFFIILSKWILIFYIYRDFSYDFSILLNFNDASYFPFIVSLSELNLSPTFNEYFVTEKLITFPIASIIFHAFFYKIFGLISYVILEITFVVFVYYLIYTIIKKAGVSENTAILGTIFFFSFPIFFEYLNYFYSNNFLLHLKEQIFDYHLIDFRFPRPLVTNLFFYCFLIYLFKFSVSENSNRYDYIFLGVFLSLLLQSFIYLFILGSLSFAVFFLMRSIRSKVFFFSNIKNLTILICVFTVFSFPFFYQYLFSEPDYSSRMGLFPFDFDIKKRLFIETLSHFFNIKYFFLLVFFSFFYLFLKRYNSKVILFYRFYLVIFILSLCIPFLFITISPYLIWFKHFFDVKNLVFMLGILLIFSFFIDIFLNKYSLNKSIFFFIFSFLLIINFTYYYNSISKNYSFKKNYFVDLNEVIKKSNLIITKNKLNIFSNSDLINYYFIYKNQNILFPQGFHVALNDSQLETLMINSFKTTEFSKDNFKNFIKNKISWKSSNEIGQISGYKYQFNSFYTYFDINDYNQNEIDFLKNDKIFLFESIALSQKEVNRLISNFTSHKIIPEIKPNLIIVDKRKIDVDFVPSKEYSKIIDNKFFILFNLKQ